MIAPIPRARASALAAREPGAARVFPTLGDFYDIGTAADYLEKG